METDLSDIRTVEEFCGALNQLGEAYGLSPRDIDRKSTGVALPNNREDLHPAMTTTTRLRRAVIHDMLSGRSPLTEGPRPSAGTPSAARSPRRAAPA